MGEVLNCKDVAEVLFEEIKEESDILIDRGINPTLAIVRVGKREDDMSYERGILKNCQKVNIKGEVYESPENVTIEDFIKVLESLNRNPSIHGILIFRPLPKHLDENRIKHLINPNKDIDCMNPINVARVFEGEYVGFSPCTPAAVMEIIKRFKINIEGKKTVVIGRSMVVGKPLSMMLLKENATVTICHSKTEDLKSISSDADILVAAIGKAKFVRGEFVKPGAVVIDVGINMDEEGKLCGDVDFESVVGKASFITPVPGGVGSVTTALLLKHVIIAAKK